MTKNEFLELVNSKIVVLDGATGMNLMKKGMPKGVCPEKWILENKEVMLELQKDFVEAGTDILYAPTFTCNRIKLEEYGLEDDICEMNRELIKISREAAAEKALVAGDITMTGRQLYPMGTMKFEELVNIYKEQVSYMLMEGVDLIVVETMMSLQECRAAVLAIKESCDLPIMVTLSFNEDNRTLYGTDPKTACVVLQSMGVDAVGVNCSTGPDKMYEVIKEMAEYATVPLIAKPNAGLPSIVNGETVYSMEVDEFVNGMSKLIDAGVRIVGGCCGTTKEFIKELAIMTKSKKIDKVIMNDKSKRVLTTERKTLDIDINGRFMVVGERINPTGKKALQAELRDGILDIVSTMAEEQVELGADILDVNVGMNGIDEEETMLKVLDEVMRVVDVPLSIDSSYINVIEAALRIYPGRALINSVSLEKEKFEKLIPIAKKYGAMFILLPLSDEGLPKNIDDKKRIINTILNRAYEVGLCKEDVVVDGLVATIGANKNAAIEVMETIRYCKNELGLATICGLSNISFGLPQRQFVNSTFLAFAIKEGLTMAIANPKQDLLMNTAFASDLLKNVDGSDIRYINKVNEKEEIISDNKTKVFEEVVKGNKRTIIESVKKELDKGTKASEILDTMLISAINHVGKLFDQKIYFLPQLIASAETMKIAIDYLEPFLAQDSTGEKKDTIIIATVEGDIHDIGKNLVALMLKNYGYNVIDMGKDVPAENIISKAKETNAKIIALSALMTTTMMEMKKVVEMVKSEKLDVKVIIGGAVVTQDFADEISADGYSEDAQESVAVVKRLLSMMK